MYEKLFNTLFVSIFLVLFFSNLEYVFRGIAQNLNFFHCKLEDSSNLLRVWSAL